MSCKSLSIVDGEQTCADSRMHAPAGIPLERVCAVCKYHTERDGSEANPALAVEWPACVHRGELVRHQRCKACGLRDVLVAVMKCDLFGECSQKATGIKGVEPCSCCEKRAAN